MGKPVEKDDIVRERIIDISHEGQGIIKIDGYTVFVKDGLIDDLVEVKISKTKKNFGFGKIVRIVEESKFRIESKCPVSKTCGGCQFQELDYSKELEYKEDMVRNNLERIGGIKNPPVEKIIAMEEPSRYRNNVQIPVGMNRGYPIMGYFKKSSNQIVDTDTCLIQDEIADRAMRLLREFMIDNNIQGYNPKTGKGLIRHLIVRNSKRTKDTMIIIVTNKKGLPKKDRLVKLFTESMKEVTSIVNNINTGDASTLLGDRSEILFGEGHIIDYIADLKFRISPESFFQVNGVQTEKLYGKVKEFLQLKKTDSLVDLYCGIGTIGMYLAGSCREVIGIELVKESIVDARKNLRLNKIDNMSFREGYAEDVFPSLVKEGIGVDALVVDPPRKGLDSTVVESIIDLRPEKLVYVSCEPSTLARDLSILKDFYKITKVQPVDMFPRTSHVETLVLLEKYKN